MSESTPAVALPMYVELAPAASQPAGTDSAILRDYLGILACYFEKRGIALSTTTIGTALSMLPGLTMQNATQAHKEITVPQPDVAAGLAAILADNLGAPGNPAGMLPLARPMLGRCDDGNDAAEVTLIVLQRPPGDTPTLGSMTLKIRLREDANASKPACILSVDSSRTSYSFLEEPAAGCMQFVGQMKGNGLIANLEATPGYMAIPI